jgi:hypothetical protein
VYKAGALGAAGDTCTVGLVTEPPPIWKELEYLTVSADVASCNWYVPATFVLLIPYDELMAMVVLTPAVTAAPRIRFNCVPETYASVTGVLPTVMLPAVNVVGNVVPVGNPRVMVLLAARLAVGEKTMYPY